MVPLFVISTPYHVDTHSVVKESPRSPSQQEDVTVPNFRETDLPVPIPVHGHRQQQQLKHDEVEKVHNKLEKKECLSWKRLQKREFLRESNAQEIKQNQGSHVTSAKSKRIKSLLPDPHQLTHIVVEKEELVPVMAFGQPLPIMKPQPFSLPWPEINQTSRKVCQNENNNTFPDVQSKKAKSKTKFKFEKVGSRQYNVVKTKGFRDKLPTAAHPAAEKLNATFSGRDSNLNKSAGRLNTSTYSLRNTTLDRSLVTESCWYICITCGSSEYTESAYKRHLSVRHYRQKLLKKFGSSVKKNRCEYCDFSSKSTTDKVMAMITHLGVKHDEVFKIQSMDK